MKTYEVEVWKTYTAYTTVTVQAADEDAAEEAALSQAEFSLSSLEGDDEGAVSISEIEETEVTEVV